MGAVIYIRVSTSEKLQLSLGDQEAICRTIAGKMGYQVLQVFRDERSRGVRREGLQALLQAIEDDESVGACFFWHASRMWGHDEQRRRIMGRAKLAGVRLIDGKEKEWKSDTPLEELVNILSSGTSEYETATTTERVYDTHSEKVRSGKIVQRPPYGVRINRRITNSADGNPAIEKSFAIDPEAIDVVRWVFRSYADGRPAYWIAAQLTERRTPTPSGRGSWTASNIRRMLDNSFYIGQMIWNRTASVWDIDPITGDKIKSVQHREKDSWITAESPLGCILADDPNNPIAVAEALTLFDACQERKGRQGRESRKRKYENRVLDGLVKCGRCGYTMQARKCGHPTKDGQPSKAWDYRCQHAYNANKGCTKSHSMTEKKIFSHLLAITEEGFGTDELVSWQMPETPKSVAEAQLRRAIRNMGAAETQLSRFMQRDRQGDYDNVPRSLYDSEKAAAIQAYRSAEDAVNAAKFAVERRSDVPLVTTMSDSTRVTLRRLIPQLQDESIPIDDRRTLARKAFEWIRIDNPRVIVQLTSAEADS